MVSLAPNTMPAMTVAGSPSKAATARAIAVTETLTIVWSQNRERCSATLATAALERIARAGAPNPMTIQNQGIFASLLTNDFLFNLAIDAAKDKGLAKILAEPTLTTPSSKRKHAPRPATSGFAGFISVPRTGLCVIRLVENTGQTPVTALDWMTTVLDVPPVHCVNTAFHCFAVTGIATSVL